MESVKNLDLKCFRFRGLHPHIFIGTASDRYAGWIGQIYSAEKYRGRITHRSHTVGGKVFREEVMPVDSVREYFEHFSFWNLTIPSTDLCWPPDGEPTSNYYVLGNYTRYLKKEDRVFLKVPQEVCAVKIRQETKTVVNPHYLNSQIFLDRFYRPVKQIAGIISGGDAL